MKAIKSISVFCGSSSGVNPLYAQKAKELGFFIGSNNYHLVYGGGNIGLMGIIANAALKAGGKVTGVLPHFLNKKEVGHVALSKLLLVDSMHERKQKIEQLSDAFIAMPGGFGTLEEVSEMLTWAQLGLHQKPIGLYNINNFYDSLLTQMDVMVKEGFLKPQNRNMVLEGTCPEQLIATLKAYRPVAVLKWLKPDQS
ncbi:MAG: TIGR00730 family Rossman fold protein [Cyclobacteriaceae bacterium]|nr:TIGR00730 family Rossman fold protein [Cyclobacteriaceae bacterium]